MKRYFGSLSFYLLFRTLYAAETSRNRQIQCEPFLMEKDEEDVKIREGFFMSRNSL